MEKIKENIKKVKIETEYIKLDSFLKLAGAASTGGYAKMVITGGEVKVNGIPCFMRGKKLHENDTATFEDETYMVVK